MRSHSSSRSAARVLCAAGICLASLSLHAGDWPRWLGPNGDNIAPAAEQFDADVSKWKVAWKANVGRGYSAVVVAGNRAFTLGHDEKSGETVFCFDATSGEVLWKHAYEAQLMPAMHPGGPNATPTVVGNHVITLSKDGQVFCLTADKGTKVWQASLTEAMEIKVPQWGFASSAVVDGDQVLFSAGKVVALDRATGKTLWTSKSTNKPGYTTAVAFTADGKKFIAAMDATGLSVLTNPGGEEVARHPYKAMFEVTASTPYVLAQGKRLLISGNQSAELLGFDGQKLTPLWTSTELKTALNNSVLLDGVLYGIDGRQGTAARFVAVNLEDGKVKWAKPAFGYGTTIGVGKTLLALTENGELATVKSSPEAFSEIGRQQVLGKTCWTPPVYANQRIYVRNDRGDVVCLVGS